MTPRSRAASPEVLLAGADPGELEALRTGCAFDPHRVLGVHSARGGAVVRAFHPDAESAACLPRSGGPVAMTPLGGGLFGALLAGAELPLRYRLRFGFTGGGSWEREDPYRFLPTLGEADLRRFSDGDHRRLWEVLGATSRQLDGVSGVAFAVWAPNARSVSVLGDFCGWDARLLPMRSLGRSGVFELFVPGVDSGALYRFQVTDQSGTSRLKADPMASAMELPPGTASRVFDSSFGWSDGEWMAGRAGRDWTREPISIYEVHLGSWARSETGHFLGYRELANRLADHALGLGFTHVELLPLAEHAFYGSWGYQVTGYYAPTARYGSPDDLRFLVDVCHRRGLGVILDWVPAHFPRDDFSLARFDGTPLYEHADPRRGEHPDWGTLIFDYGRREVRNFLLANALYWLREFHFDGLRVDAVASMLYLDYSRKAGEWLPNRHGGRENLEAVELLRAVNEAVREEAPGAVAVAEESTAWPGVTRPVAEGGLGFHFKWNMGWMHDTLAYLAREPIHRRHHQDQLGFAMVYEHSERFVNPLSHDEVVHGKCSLLEKMPGDAWQKFANLRLLLAYQFTRPGKQLLFMGSELAPEREWNHDEGLDWQLARDPSREGLARFLTDLGRLYRERPSLWSRDPDPEGFEWIDCSDAAQSVFSYVRTDGAERTVVVLNATPVPRPGYRIGAPEPGRYVELLSSDAPGYGGSEFETPPLVETEPRPWHGRPQSLVLDLPPLAALVLAPARGA